MYSFTSRIRFSEVDTHLNLTLGSVIDYLQHCSTFHSEAVGMNIARLSAMKRAWILSSWQIVPVRFPKLGEKVNISNWPYDFRLSIFHDDRGRRLMSGLCQFYLDLHGYVDGQTGEGGSGTGSVLPDRREVSYGICGPEDPYAGRN